MKTKVTQKYTLFKDTAIIYIYIFLLDVSLLSSVHVSPELRSQLPSFSYTYNASPSHDLSYTCMRLPVSFYSYLSGSIKHFQVVSTNGVINRFSSVHQVFFGKKPGSNPLSIPNSVNGMCHFLCVEDNHIHTLFLKCVVKFFYHANKRVDIFGECCLNTWCLVVMTSTHLPECQSPTWNSAMTFATSGSVTIQRRRALGTEGTTAPPFPLMQALFCSCA